MHKLYTLVPRRRNNGSCIPFKQLQDEIIGMQRFNAKRSQYFAGKIPQIGRHNHTGIAMNGSGQYVTVIRVWQRQICNQAP